MLPHTNAQPNAYTDARDQLEAAIGNHARDITNVENLQVKIDDDHYPYPAMNVRVCPHGCHIVAATRWERRCDRCHQAIQAGAVGFDHAFGDLTTRCMVGRNSWRHHCGEPMPPSEHAENIDTDAINLNLDALVNEARDDGELDDAIDEFAWRLVKQTIMQLKADVDRERMDAHKQTWRALFDQLDHALREVHQGVPPEEVVTGDDMEPGVQLEDGELRAWDFDPLAQDGEPLTITPKDFELVGPAEVARLAGLSELTVRTYVKRDAIVRPAKVCGSDALVWHRQDVDGWLYLRDERGETP